MADRSIRTNVRLVALMSFISIIWGTFLPIQVNLHVHAQSATTSPTAIHAGGSWKGTESDLNGGNVLPVKLQITSIVSGQSDPIRGTWKWNNNPGPYPTIFIGSEETYAQAYPGSLTDVIKIWGKSPIDRYITFTMTGTISGYIVEEANGDFKGIYISIMGQESWTKFILNKNIVPGGMWVYPDNGFIFARGKDYTIIVKGYKSNVTDPAIAYVNVTGYWSNAWHAICHIPNNRPDLGDFYYCTTDLKLNGKYPPDGTMKLSFDVYDVKGNKNLAPNGTPNGKFSTIATSLSKAEDTLDQKAKPILADMGHKQSAMGELLGATMLAAACGVELFGAGLLKLPGKLEHAGIIIVKFYEIYDNGRSGSAIALDIISKQYWDVFIEVVHAINPLDACTTIFKYDTQILYISLQGLVKS